MPGERYWEIDLARGIAVVTMILFHSAFDLNFFGVLPLDVSGGFLRMLAYLTASTFIFLVGISFTISYARTSERLAGRALALKYVRRGLTIFGYGLVITAVTWLFLPSVYVVFGILHFIGIAILLAPLFFRFDTEKLLITSIACLIAGYATSLITGPWPLLWIGIRPESFTSLDYVPLLPWFGLVLVGMACGHLFYPDGRRNFSIPVAKPAFARPLEFLGRHSLVIYFLHQPIILLVIAVLAPGAVTGLW
ncbi:MULTISPECIES: heparan-alpha-glucosaminide N-acetyltransferase [unclassified Methanoculleus]|uniref:heparan-alpha-glucosaminide N-acetyltransferase n=1 Tax=unclassified Methanoculleus TaxID=2619537 RepID=UPI0025DB90F3|nr:MULTISPECIES: heparan-alpha-glucosaminide N-acetyltransferase [unclassified Methanoculleus]